MTYAYSVTSRSWMRFADASLLAYGISVRERDE